jgi:hypothetical protein
MPTEERILCNTPAFGKKGTRIPKWKYDALRAAIRKVVPRNREGVEFRKLAGLVKAALPPDVRERIGSIPWHTITVKLHLETIGEIQRIPARGPQRIRLAR